MMIPMIKNIMMMLRAGCIPYTLISPQTSKIYRSILMEIIGDFGQRNKIEYLLKRILLLVLEIVCLTSGKSEKKN